MSNHSQYVSLIRSIADLLRWSRKQYEYQDIILPFVVLRRLDCILEKSKPLVLETYHKFQWQVEDISPILKKTAGYDFYNTSVFDFKKLLDDPANIATNLNKYILWFSTDVQDIFDKFKFQTYVARLKKGNALYEIVKNFESIDLHIDAIDNLEMGYIFEELIRKFSEQSNDTAWEHYTPRDVIKVMVELMFINQVDDIKHEWKIKRIYDPCSWTWGMLTVAKDYILNVINPKARIYVYGQEINPITYAVCKADMLIKWEDIHNIKWWQEEGEVASTLSNDQLPWEQFDYILSNPPYGVDWKRDKSAIEKEAERGYAGRFGAWTPRISDGQLLFLQHMISKMQPISEWWSRVSVIMNGSPLFTGNAWGGESEIRRRILESDLLETIVALPDQLFYNTGINTYIWILSNDKEAKRKGKVQLIDARSFCTKMRKSLGNKRNELSEEHQQKIHQLYEAFEENEYCKIFNTTDFSYRQITIEQPEVDEHGNIVKDSKGNPKANTTKRDTENVPYGMDVNEYFEKEVKPYLPDAWINESSKYCDKKDGKVGIVGYEINFTRYFYTYSPPRALEAIEADILQVEGDIQSLLASLGIEW